MKKLLTVFMMALMLLSLACCESNKTDNNNNNEDNNEVIDDNNKENETVESGYKVSFSVDSNVKVIVYNSQEDLLNLVNGTEALIAYSLDSETGNETKVDGQVNFLLVFSEGYILDNIEISGTYNKLKGSTDTGVENGYRITKINSDLEVNITSKQEEKENEEILEEGYEVTFDLDSNVSVLVYKTQDLSSEGIETNVAYSRDSATGALTLTDGQVNFVLVFSDGYVLDTLEISGEYKNLKGSADTGKENAYRITKIASDLVVKVTSKKAEDNTEENLEDGYKVSFVLDSNVSVLVYKTQDLSNDGLETDVAYSRDSATGALTLTDGQVNFVLVFSEGYELDEITVSGSYKNLKGPSDVGEDNAYRITKIASELIVTVTSKKKITENSGSNSEENTNVSSITINSNYNNEALVLKLSMESGTFDYSYQDNVLIVKINKNIEEAIFSASGAFYGTIEFDANSNTDIELGLNGVTIYTEGSLPCIYVLDGNNFDLSAKKGTVNYLYDKRSEECDLGSSVYVTCDMTLKGTGSLFVESTNNNGIHTKDDLQVKNLTLEVNCVDNALKGNDSVTIGSGTLTLIARQGDGIKTSNSTIKYNSDGSIKKIQGTISILGGDITIYSACDGIDARYNVEIEGGNVTIYTDKYSSYSEEVTNVEDDVIYIRNTTTTYKYSIYYYNSSTDYVWKNSSSYKTVSSGRTNYYYYPIEKVSGYSNIIVYYYSNNQTQGQSSSYTLRSSNMTINNNYDTITYNSSRGQFSWTNYSTTTQSPWGMGPGGMGPGGGGNTNKGDYSTKGIKASNEILISGGTINIKSYDDGIHTNNDVVLGDEDDSSDDYYGTGNITISGGNITIYSNDDGIHADQDLTICGNAYINVTYSYEGLEANRIYFDGGETYVYATDDAANAAKCNGKYSPLVTISGGYIDLAVGSGDTDTLDSNGNVIITGGTIILKNAQNNGSSMTGGTIDLDGTLKITGGNVISIGCWCNEANMTAQASSTSQTLSQGTYTVKDSSGNVITTFNLSQSYRGYRMYFSNKTSTYTVYLGSNSVITIK